MSAALSDTMHTQASAETGPSSTPEETADETSLARADFPASSTDLQFVSRKGRNAVISEFAGPIFTTRIEGDGEGAAGDTKLARHLLLTRDEYEGKLRSASFTVKSEDGKVAKGWDVASYGVNVPNEDKSVVDVLPLSGLSELAEGRVAGQSIFQAWKRAKDWNNAALAAATDKGEGAGSHAGELLMSSVIDGHGNNASVAGLLQKTLHVAIAQNLASVWEKGTMTDESEVRKAISDT